MVKVKCESGNSIKVLCYLKVIVFHLKLICNMQQKMPKIEFDRRENIANMGNRSLFLNLWIGTKTFIRILNALSQHYYIQGMKNYSVIFIDSFFS